MAAQARREDGRADAPGLAINYPRSGVSATCGPPEGWLCAQECAVVAHGVLAFDRLSERLMELDVHARAGLRLRAQPQDDEVLAARSGPLRGRCRLLERIDESLRQGVVIGTAVGNPTVAEHRCVLELRGPDDEVSACVRTVWRPGREFVLPGALERERRGQLRLVHRLAAELAGLAEAA